MWGSTIVPSLHAPDGDADDLSVGPGLVATRSGVVDDLDLHVDPPRPHVSFPATLRTGGPDPAAAARMSVRRPAGYRSKRARSASGTRSRCSGCLAMKLRT